MPTRSPEKTVLRELRNIQQDFLNTPLGQAEPPSMDLAEELLDRIGGEHYIYRFFEWVSACQFSQRDKAPGQPFGPTGWTPFLHWAIEFKCQCQVADV
jgi:hypothetical protein